MGTTPDLWINASAFFLNEKLTLKPNHNKPQLKPSTFFLFKLLYLEPVSVSHHIEKELQQFNNSQLPNSKVTVIRTINKLKQHFNFKGPQHP